MNSIVTSLFEILYNFQTNEASFYLEYNTVFIWLKINENNHCYKKLKNVKQPILLKIKRIFIKDFKIKLKLFIIVL